MRPGASLAAALVAAAASVGGMGVAADRASQAAQAFSTVAATDRSTPAPNATGDAARDRWMRRFFAGTTGAGGVGSVGGVHGPAGTNRQYQRAARKRRNVARNRRAHRG